MDQSAPSKRSRRNWTHCIRRWPTSRQAARLKATTSNAMTNAPLLVQDRRFSSPGKRPTVDQRTTHLSLRQENALRPSFGLDAPKNFDRIPLVLRLVQVWMQAVQRVPPSKGVKGRQVHLGVDTIRPRDLPVRRCTLILISTREVSEQCRISSVETNI